MANKVFPFWVLFCFLTFYGTLPRVFYAFLVISVRFHLFWLTVLIGEG